MANLLEPQEEGLSRSWEKESFSLDPLYSSVAFTFPIPLGSIIFRVDGLLSVVPTFSVLPFVPSVVYYRL